MRHPFVVCLYAAAMGILEAIVVVYLRKLYYPDGFRFPLVAMDRSILHAEIIREAMTLVMIFSVAWIAAAGGWSRFMAFVTIFGMWDLTYYAGLKVLLGWPSGLLTPDVLFLIPRVWVGPVLAPVLVASGMVLTGLLLHRTRYRDLRPGRGPWAVAGLGTGLILVSFLLPQVDPAVPRFSWPLFGAGYVLGLAVLARTAMAGRRRI